MSSSFDPAAYQSLRANLAQLRAMRVEESDPALAAALDARIAKLDAELAEVVARNPLEVGNLKKKAPGGAASPEQILQEALANLPKKDQPSAVPEPAPAPQAEPEPEEPVEPPTPEQMVEADRLIQLARVEKMRGNAARSTEILEQASAVAPGAPSVLEMLGDDLAERKRFREARDAYGTAVKLDPKNVGLETKYAEMVLRGGTNRTADEMLRMGYSDSPFLTPDDHVANANVATILNLFVPGIGQIVMGRTVSGIVILAVWLVCVGFLVAFRQDLGQLFKSMAGGSSQISGSVIAPLLLGGAVHLGAILNAASIAKAGGASRQRVEKPTPPVNLPFE